VFFLRAGQSAKLYAAPAEKIHPIQAFQELLPPSRERMEAIMARDHYQGRPDNYPHTVAATATKYVLHIYADGNIWDLAEMSAVKSV